MSNDLLRALEGEPADNRISNHAAAYRQRLLRRRWWALGPLFLLGLSGYAVSRVWPLPYRSEAFLAIEPSSVPERYVAPNVQVSLQNRVANIAQQILNPTWLPRTITDLQMSELQDYRLSTDQAVALLRKQVNIEVIRASGASADGGVVRISFQAPDPERAQRVTAALTSAFIAADVQLRSEEATGTQEFLDNELRQAEKALADQDALVRAYKQRHAGQLPEQQQVNVQIVSGLEMQLRAVTDALERAQQERVYLSAMARHYQSVASANESTDAAADPPPAAIHTPTEAALEDLRTQVAALKSRFTDAHPDVIRAKQAIAILEDRVKREKENTPAPPPKKVAPQHRSLGEDVARAETESRLKALNTEIENLNQQVVALQRRLQDESNQLSSMPIREQELAELLRNSENARSNYQSLLAKKRDSELTNSLETRQQGERFTVLNSATLPRGPEGRARIVAIGWILGLFCGIGMVFVVEKTDPAIHSEHELAGCTALPVVVRIPSIRNARQQRQRVWDQAIEGALLTLLCLISAATAAHTLLAG